MNLPKGTNYNICGKDLRKIARDMAIVVSVTWLVLALGTVQVLGNVDKTVAFLVILFVGMVANAAQLAVLFLYLFGYLMTVAQPAPEDKDEQPSKDL